MLCCRLCHYGKIALIGHERIVHSYFPDMLRLSQSLIMQYAYQRFDRQKMHAMFLLLHDLCFTFPLRVSACHCRAEFHTGFTFTRRPTRLKFLIPHESQFVYYSHRILILTRRSHDDFRFGLDSRHLSTGFIWPCAYNSFAGARRCKLRNSRSRHLLR